MEEANVSEHMLHLASTFKLRDSVHRQHSTKWFTVSTQVCHDTVAYGVANESKYSLGQFISSAEYKQNDI